MLSHFKTLISKLALRSASYFSLSFFLSSSAERASICTNHSVIVVVLWLALTAVLLTRSRAGSLSRQQIPLERVELKLKSKLNQLSQRAKPESVLSPHPRVTASFFSCFFPSSLSFSFSLAITKRNLLKSHLYHKLAWQHRIELTEFYQFSCCFEQASIHLASTSDPRWTTTTTTTTTTTSTILLQSCIEHESAPTRVCLYSWVSIIAKFEFK